MVARSATSSFMVPLALSGWLECERASYRALMSPGLAAAQRGWPRRGRVAGFLRLFTVEGVWGRGVTKA